MPSQPQERRRRPGCQQAVGQQDALQLRKLGGRSRFLLLHGRENLHQGAARQASCHADSSFSSALHVQQTVAAAWQTKWAGERPCPVFTSRSSSSTSATRAAAAAAWLWWLAAASAALRARACSASPRHPPKK